MSQDRALDPETLAVLAEVVPAEGPKYRSKIVPLANYNELDNVMARIELLVAQGYSEFTIVHEHPVTGKIVRIVKNGFRDFWQVIPGQQPKPVPAIVLRQLGLIQQTGATDDKPNTVPDDKSLSFPPIDRADALVSHSVPAGVSQETSALLQRVSRQGRR